MSIFDAGFIMWGFFLFYALLTGAYLVWMVLKNKNERQRDGHHLEIGGGRS